MTRDSKAAVTSLNSSTNIYDAIQNYKSAIDICAEFGAVTAPLLARVKSSNDVIYVNVIG